MFPAEIKPSEKQSKRASKILSLLREGVSQAGESSHLHPYSKIVSLDNRCADTLRVGVSINNIRYYVHHYGWRVSVFVALRGSIDFYQLSEINLFMSKLMNDAITVLGESIGCYLKAMVGCSGRQLLSEKPGVAKGSSAEMPSKDQLGISLESNKRVRITQIVIILFDSLFGLLFHFHKTPYFVTLNVFNGDVLNVLV